jgi:hypothetical protein
VNGTHATITCDEHSSTVRLDSLSIPLIDQTLQCRLESDFLDVTEKSNNATIMFLPTDPVISPSKLETHKTAKFTCTHTRGFPVYWNISSQVPINPMYVNGTEVSTLTIESVSPGMNLTEIQCWQNMFESVVTSESATLIVLDIDECANSSWHNCSQQCRNTIGSYECSCFSGYQLGEDGFSCKDIDECANSSWHNCSQQCRNTIGSYEMVSVVKISMNVLIQVGITALSSVETLLDLTSVLAVFLF